MPGVCQMQPIEADLLLTQGQTYPKYWINKDQVIIIRQKKACGLCDPESLKVQYNWVSSAYTVNDDYLSHSMNVQ